MFDQGVIAMSLIMGFASAWHEPVLHIGQTNYGYVNVTSLWECRGTGGKRSGGHPPAGHLCMDLHEPWGAQPRDVEGLIFP
jgi:hypothetical protein